MSHNTPKLFQSIERNSIAEKERQQKIDSLAAMALSLQHRISNLMMISSSHENNFERNSVVEIFMKQYSSVQKQDSLHTSSKVEVNPILEKVSIEEKLNISQSKSILLEDEEKKIESPKLSPRSLRTQFQAEMHKYRSLVEADNQLSELNRIHQVESALIPKPEMEHKSTNTSVLLESRSVNTIPLTTESKSTVTIESTFEFINSTKPKMEHKSTSPSIPFSTQSKSTSTKHLKVEHKSTSPSSSLFDESHKSVNTDPVQLISKSTSTLSLIEYNSKSTNTDLPLSPSPITTANKMVNTQVSTFDSKATDTKSLVISESKSNNTVPIPTEDRAMNTTTIQYLHKGCNTESFSKQETKHKPKENGSLNQEGQIILNAITEMIIDHSKIKQNKNSLLEHITSQLALMKPTFDEKSRGSILESIIKQAEDLHVKEEEELIYEENSLKMIIADKLFDILLEDTINTLNSLLK